MRRARPVCRLWFGKGERTSFVKPLGDCQRRDGWGIVDGATLKYENGTLADEVDGNG